MPTRRQLLLTACAGLIARPALSAEPRFEITLTDAEWRARLTPAQYAVLRDRVTEHAFTNHLGTEASPLLNETRMGSYDCAGCGLAVYRAETKYDSGTGWPSFGAAIAGAVLPYDDSGFFIRRTGLQCRRCGGHFGHRFDDGPPPTGHRHCLNGLALTFTPDSTGITEGFPAPRA